MNSEDDLLKDYANRLRQLACEFTIYIFGAGTYGKVYGEFFNQTGVEWKGFIDNNPILQHKKICKKKVYSYEEIKDKENACIIISLSSIVHKNLIDEIKLQLVAQGFHQEVIIYDGKNLDLMDKMVYFVNSSGNALDRNVKLKDVYSGKRCFIIGNGPSLKISDLEMIMNEVTMSCNSTIDLFEKTMWRPTCFFCEDSDFIAEKIRNQRILEKLLENTEYVFTTLRSSLFTEYGLKYSNLFFLYTKRNIKKIKFSDDICKEIYSAGTTLYTMMQTAVYMGIKEIYLIGVDFSFRKEMNLEGKIIVHEGVANHMKEMNQKADGTYFVELMLEGYKCALQYANSHGIKIYNATRGGKLEIFERVDFDNLF